jgi:methionine aminopeptidase
MTSLNKLFDLRRSLIKFENNLGLSDLSDLEKAMLEFIGNQAVDNATLTDIIQDDYFKNYSLSTIKRGLVSLIDKGKRHTKLNVKDGWTVTTKDGRLSAQWEHTLAVTSTGCEVFTRRRNENLPC